MSKSKSKKTAPQSTDSVSAKKIDSKYLVDKQSNTTNLPNPTLSTFFKDKSVSPTIFIKSVTKNKIKKFENEDIDNALNLMNKLDQSGERLWTILSIAKLPDVLNNCILQISQKRLNAEIGLDTSTSDNNAILSTLIRLLSPKLKTKSQKDTKYAENWLRIGVCWLIGNRSMKVRSVMKSLGPVYVKNKKDIRNSVNELIKKGSDKELKVALSMYYFFQDEINTLEKINLAEIEKNLNLTDKRTSLESELNDCKKNTDSLQSQLSEKLNEIVILNDQIKSDKRHSGHNLSETKAKQRLLLGKRITPLITDALDALEIDPPSLRVAISRLKKVLISIEEEIN